MKERTCTLEYRNSRIAELQHSPAQLLMNRMLRDKLPTHPDLLKPKVVGSTQELQKRQQRQKGYYGQAAKLRCDRYIMIHGDSARNIFVLK